MRDCLPGLARNAHALTGDAHAAEDLVQETLVKVAGAWRRLDADGNPIAYAKTAMFRTYVSWWRVRVRRPPALPLPEMASQTDAYAQVEARDSVRRTLAGLPRLQRAVLVATYLDDAPDEVIAELVGRTPTTVRSLRRRGLMTLRAQLARQVPRPAAPEVQGHPDGGAT